MLDGFKECRNVGWWKLPIGPRERQLLAELADELDRFGYQALRDSACQEHEVQLSYLARRTASMSVRSSDPSDLPLALVALCLAGLGKGNRDAIMTMSVVARAATLVGTTHGEILRRASQLVGPAGAEDMEMVASIPPRPLSMMAFKEVSDEDGFRFERSW